MMILAEKIGRPIDPDIMWKRFFSPDSKIAGKDGAIWVSTLLDIAREYGIASHFDITNDIDRAAGAITDPKVAGVLMTTERNTLEPSSEAVEGVSHLWVVHRFGVDSRNDIGIEVESANMGESSRIDIHPDKLFQKMLRSFLVLVK
jgi:hypothetical protein